MKFIAFFDAIRLQDVPQFGGKNASLGEMINGLKAQGIRVPDGFAISADAYRYYVEHNNLLTAMHQSMHELHDIHDLDTLKSISAHIQELFIQASFPDDLAHEIMQAYEQLSHMYTTTECDVAVRSSATAEDLPGASFAGQQETFLHIVGNEMLLQACKRCMASLFTERAIVYRREQGINDFDVALSIGVQKMIRSDQACSGVMFTLDPETGFKSVITLNASYGLGEMVVQGLVNPDEFVIHKEMLAQGFSPFMKKVLGGKEEKLVYQEASEPLSSWVKKFTPSFRQGSLHEIAASLEHPFLQVQQEKVQQVDRDSFCLTDNEVLELARYGLTIEQYYSQLKGHWSPMDIEWAKDAIDGKLYIVQARPETVYSKKKYSSVLVGYCFEQKPSQGQILLTGQSVGKSVAAGRVCVMQDVNEHVLFKQGDVLVADMTDPDWVPLMKKASAIITNRGGRTCHAAIVSRELGIPAVIGTEKATEVLHDGQSVTVDCSQGAQGFVYNGIFAFKQVTTDLASLQKPSVDLFVNIGNPDGAYNVAELPVAGVGLARLEFIISSLLKVHPMAVAYPEKVTDQVVQHDIQRLAVGYASVRDYFINKLAQSVAMIAGSFYPRPVVVRLTDFKTNEYRDLLGGSYFEPQEENPMLGFRGAVRYCSEQYAPAFALECAALKKVREEMGFDNVILMVPFVRTVKEAQRVIEILADHGLKRGEKGLKLYMMVEIPSNVIIFEQFAPHFDGFSIGSNDLTQLTLGVDRDSGILSSLFDERDPAVKEMIRLLLEKAKTCNAYMSICGQGPSDHPDFAQFLIEQGISALSLTPDSVIPFLKNT